MHVKQLTIQSFRSFDNPVEIRLGQMNVFIGKNNSGKSSVLRALSQMQAGMFDPGPDVRLGSAGSHVELVLRDLDHIPNWSVASPTKSATLHIFSGGRMTLALSQGNPYDVSQLPPRDPDHFIVPYFSKRKVASYSEDVRQQAGHEVGPTITNLAAKLARVSNPHHPSYDRYSQTCEAILGFVVTAIPSANGMRPGLFISEPSYLPIDQMGEGVPNIVALLVELSLAKGKIFLIEEPENDLHPEALKALLELIVESSSENQFVVSTHSNIVVRHLCAAADSRLYKTSASKDRPPVSSIELVDATPEARIEVLRELGYSFSDFDLWDGWLILEESSAEQIIQGFLIPWFVPELARVRTLSAGGNTKVEATFEDFNRLVRFTHLEQAYRNSAWVRIDGDEQGKLIVETLRGRYSTWKPEHFGYFKHAEFERYYPAHFAERVETVLQTEGKQAKRDAKRGLLLEVLAWLKEDGQRGRDALAASASEVIEFLQTIRAELIKPKESRK